MPGRRWIDRLRSAKTGLPFVFPDTIIFESIIELLHIKIIKRLEETFENNLIKDIKEKVPKAEIETQSNPMRWKGGPSDYDRLLIAA
jgi:hypothetical protein